MLMVDENKAVLVGRADIIISEVAFIMDKLCTSDTGPKSSYQDIQDMLLREVGKLQKERESGHERSHPNDVMDNRGSGSGSNSRSKGKGKGKGESKAEKALVEAMAKIEELRAEKEQAKQAKQEKAKKKTKKLKKKNQKDQ